MGKRSRKALARERLDGGGDHRKRAEEELLAQVERAEQLRRFFRRRHKQKVAGWILALLGPVILFGHLAEHAGSIRIMPIGWEDLLIGFPTGSLMLVAAGILFGQSDLPPSERTSMRP